MERNIPDFCLGKKTKALCSETSLSVPALNIQPGDNIDYVLHQIIESSPVLEESSNFISSKLFCIGGNGNSICASKIIVRNLSYAVAAGTPGEILFSWDMDDIRSSLPAGYTVFSVDVEGHSPNSISTLFNSSSIRAAANISFKKYPITVDFRLRIITDCGQIELVKSVYLYNPSLTGTFIKVMDLKDYTAEAIQDITQNEFNELLAGEICTIKDRISVIEDDINLSEEIASVQSRLNLLEGVDILDTPVSQTACVTGIVTQTTLLNFLKDLDKRLCALENV